MARSRPQIVSVISDIHFDLHDVPTWRAYRKWHSRIRPDRTIVLGDFLDLGMMSKYVQGPHDTRDPIAQIRCFVPEVNALAQEAKLVEVMEGNHDERWAKYVLGAAPDILKDAKGLSLREQCLAQGNVLFHAPPVARAASWYKSLEATCTNESLQRRRSSRSTSTRASTSWVRSTRTKQRSPPAGWCGSRSTATVAGSPSRRPTSTSSIAACTRRVRTTSRAWTRAAGFTRMAGCSTSPRSSSPAATRPGRRYERVHLLHRVPSQHAAPAHAVQHHLRWAPLRLRRLRQHSEEVMSVVKFFCAICRRNTMHEVTVKAGYVCPVCRTRNG